MKWPSIVIATVGLSGAVLQAAAQEVANPDAGREYALQACAQCHAVLPQDKVSPDARAPTFKTIANIPGMSRTAIIVWFQSPHETMPQLVLPNQDLDDVIAYIHSLKDDS